MFDKSFEFITSDYSVTEVQEHKDELKAKAKLNDDEFNILLSLVFEYVKIVPKSDYEDYKDECKNKISDPDDVPILATALAVKADGIWAHDPHFLEQKKVKIFTNKDLLKIIKP